MAEKYELDININNDGGDDGRVNDSTSGVFARPRTRNRKFSMDVFDGLKDNLGEKAYNKTLKATGSKDKANKSRFAIGYGINVFTEISSDILKTASENIGTFTSNKANQNAVDNMTSVATEALGAIGAIGAGAAAGGPVGAIAAAALVAAKKAIDIGTNAMKLAKENASNNEDTSRIRNRLGYIETGYSR